MLQPLFSGYRRSCIGRCGCRGLCGLWGFALSSRPKIFLLLLAAVVLALEETDAAAEEELLEAMAEEELVAEEDEVLRMFLGSLKRTRPMSA